MSEAHHHGAGRIFIGGLEKHRQRHDFQLHDQLAQVNAVLIHLHAAGRLAARFHPTVRVEHAAVQSQVEIHDIVQHAAGSIDLVHGAVFIRRLPPLRKGAPLVGIGRLSRITFK